MNRRITTILLLLLSSGVWAQSTNISTFFKSSVKKADHFYEHFAYRNALEIYLHINEKEPTNVYVREQIADCYFKLHNPIEAERWFEDLAKDDAISAKSKFEYAEALSMNGKYGESLYWFEAFLKDKPNDTTALEKLKFLQNIDYYNNSIDKFNVHGIANINTEHSEYGAHAFHDGVVFASSRDTQHLIKHKPSDGVHPDEALLNLFFVVPQLGDDGGTEPKEFHEEHLKTKFHEGPMAFYNKYKRGAFTRSNFDNGRVIRNEDEKITLQIFFADVNHLGQLNNIESFEHYHEDYSNAHPTFSEDGKKMYFTSTREHGKGGSDIYYCEWENGSWTYPINIGATINTPEDESFPFLLNDSTLFFSSNGHGTLGGLDVYVSYKRNGKFTKPFNIGAPANSRFDDFSLVFDSAGRNGYLASNRPGGKGLDDIYYFETKYYELVGVVRELSTEQPIIPNTLITVKKSNGGFVDSVRSDENGYFHLRLEYDKDFVLTGTKEGYESLEGLKFSTWNKPYGVDSLTLPLWKHKLFAKGTIYSNETQTPLEGAVVVLKNLTDGTADSLTMGKNGRYAFLAIPNKLYELQVKKDGYLPNGFKLNTKDLLEGDLLNDVVLEEPYLEKSLVLFNYNDATLIGSFKADLNKLMKALKRYPKSTVWIGAHADARGTPEYNLDLSNRRAKTVVDYLKANGISAKRIEAVGFGEELILNQCSSGVECSEEEHSTNRRAEVKIQKAVN
jgi:outer membrane protein OmpA-like peptidoglycan-associated protein